MMLVRSVQPNDLDALMTLARKTGVGFTSLQPDEAQLAARIERCQRTLQGTAERADQGYLFVLEDSATARVVGVSAIEVAVGLREPWYNFRLGTLTHASGALGIHKQMPILFLSNDHTGNSELCTLFLDPDWRVACNGSLLSKSRLLFMAAFRRRFADRLVAEMRGVSDVQGRSSFWESLGRHFFNMDFAKADALSGLGNKAFIAELMPKHPLYVAFLTAEARAVIGRVHPQTEPARALLESEGLRYEGYVDIFDGGATLEGYVEDLRVVRDSRIRLASRATAPAAAEAPLYLVANEREDDFRVILAPGNDDDGAFALSEEALDALRLAPDALVRSVILSRPRPGVTA